MTGNRDQSAGELLFELREAKGISPEQVPHAMRRAGFDMKHIPSARTIRRAEEGMRPQVRYRFALAEFYGVPMGSIWAPSRSRVAA